MRRRSRIAAEAMWLSLMKLEMSPLRLHDARSRMHRVGEKDVAELVRHDATQKLPHDSRVASYPLNEAWQCTRASIR